MKFHWDFVVALLGQEAVMIASKSRFLLSGVLAAPLVVAAVGGVAPATASAAPHIATASPAWVLTSVSVPSYPVVRRGTVGLSSVRTVQFLLRSNPSPRFAVAADGVFGPRTETAVRLFQKVNGLAVNGIVGQATWRKLVVTQRFGSRGEQVRAIQALLNIYGRTHAGFRLTEDGIFGRLTRAAVIRFQRAVDITDDGVVGPGTWPFLVHEAVRVEAAD